MDHPNFVCVINGKRDGYQVPVALHEAGLLARFVTDYYAPDRPPRWLPDALAQRRHPALPQAMTCSSLAGMALQYGMPRLGVPMPRVVRHTDPWLAEKAMRQARHLGAHLYCYSSYIPAGSLPAGMKLVDFEYHPLAGLSLELLRADAAQYPETAWSFANELRLAEAERDDEGWKRADAIACASQMTARSLVLAGCEPERITVIPYGFEPAGCPPARPQGGAARFLFVGQGVQRKGVHHLLRAWRGVDPARARLTLVCYHIDPAMAELARQPGVELLGRQERATLDALMRASDVFILPSLIEGFGLVYLEALAAGCHVVGTPNTGLPDLPLSDGARTLVPAGDIPALGEAIEALIRRHAAGGFDVPTIAAEAGRWTWADFRARIAAHARVALG